jgi:hypothetical protein
MADDSHLADPASSSNKRKSSAVASTTVATYICVGAIEALAHDTVTDHAELFSEPQTR